MGTAETPEPFVGPHSESSFRMRGRLDMLLLEIAVGVFSVVSGLILFGGQSADKGRRGVTLQS